MFANCLYMKPTLSIILDTRRVKNTGNYPVRLRVIFLREARYYNVGIDLSKEKFAQMQNPLLIDKKVDTSLKRHLKEWKLSCDAVSGKASGICNKFEDFNFRVFEKQFFGTTRSKKDVYEAYQETIDAMKSLGKIGTASSYQSSLSSLKGFSPKLNFRDITVEFLKDYERWLIADKKSITTVGIYLRPLRAIINQAIDEGSFSRDAYPFGKRRYQIPSGKNIKKALVREEIKRIYDYKGFSGTWLEKARDFFIFSYLANGMNMKDIAQLKNENIDGEFLRFNRAKTKDTNRTGSKPISIYLSDDLKEIIQRWKSRSSAPEGYLFDILEENNTPERESALVKQFTRMTNTYIKRICEEVKITKQVTTYYARHSFATVLYRNGQSTEMISHSLGHSNLKTTTSYLDSFDDQSQKEMQSVLTRFE